MHINDAELNQYLKEGWQPARGLKPVTNTRSSGLQHSAND